MKKFFHNRTFVWLIPAFIVFVFFVPNLLKSKIPIPADALLSLYHPWRDLKIEDFNPGRFPAKNTLITDPILQTYPWRFLVIENLKKGNIPLWNPYSFSGQPLIGNVQSSAFQIGNILFFILPFKMAWSLNIILPPAFCAVFTYFFLSVLLVGGKKLKKSAVVFGASILPFSGFFISWQQWGTVISTAMWLPLILLSINQLFKKISPAWFLLLIFAVSQTIFSGHFQTAIYVFLAAFIYLTILTIQSKRFINLLLGIIAIFLGILIASPQIVISLEFLNFSARSSDQRYFPGKADWFIPYQHLVQIVAPDLFGNPTTGNYWGVWNYGEFISYIGIFPLVFALFAVFKKTKEKEKLLFLCLFLLSFLFGLNNPLSRILYEINLPFFGSLQPSRIIFLLVFSLSCLAAFGLNSFLEEKKFVKKIIPISLILLIQISLIILASFKKEVFPQSPELNSADIALRNLVLPILISLTFILIIFLKSVNIKSRYIIVIIFLITFFDLFRFANKFLPFTKSSLIFPQTSTIEFLQEQKKPFRVMSTDRRIIHPNTLSVYGIESVEGYDPLYLKSYANFVSVWQSQDGRVNEASFNRIITPQKVNFNFMKLLNIKYLLTFDEIDNQNLTKVHQEGETKIYEFINFAPRAFFVNEVIRIQDPKEELAFLFSGNSNPIHSSTSPDISFEGETTGASLELISYNDQELTIKASAKNNTPLIISNINYPGWRAFIDNKEEKILRANSIMQMITVPSGSHNVRLKYDPKSFRFGLLLMLAGIIASAFLAIYLWRKKFQ